MKHIKNIRKYNPDSIEKKELMEKFNAIFLISEDGCDWYEGLADFKSDTVKIMYDRNGTIVAITHDASTLYPDGKSVVELDSISENVTIDGSWQFMNDEVIPRELSDQELTQQALKEKQRLLNDADKIISPLRNAIELDIATQEEKSRYMAWKKYSVMVNRTDTSDVKNINWPKCPD